MKRIQPFRHGRQRLPDLDLFRLLDLEQGQLDVFRKRLIIVPCEHGIDSERIYGELAPHDHRILQEDDMELF